jgi:hypothetical protein
MPNKYEVVVEGLGVAYSGDNVVAAAIMYRRCMRSSAYGGVEYISGFVCESRDVSFFIEGGLTEQFQPLRHGPVVSHKPAERRVR